MFTLLNESEFSKNIAVLKALVLKERPNLIKIFNILKDDRYPAYDQTDRCSVKNNLALLAADMGIEENKQDFFKLLQAVRVEKNKIQNGKRTFPRTNIYCNIYIEDSLNKFAFDRINELLNKLQILQVPPKVLTTAFNSEQLPAFISQQESSQSKNNPQPRKLLTP